MKKLLLALIGVALMAACTSPQPQETPLPADAFVRVEGPNLIKPDGSKLFIRGTNLGNWLNPEGYMFGFGRTNSTWMIDLMIKELAGPDFAAKFWKAFKDTYITRADVEYIAKTGANTIRLPFNYKLFTDEDFMGLTSQQDGFARVDSVVNWCRDNDLYLILDMHDAPGGQTGDNIDDSYGYPWLLEDEACQQQFCDIWKLIADRYKNEPVILGYELINESIAPYFDIDALNPKLEPLHKRAVKAIREVDQNHIILLGGPQWNSIFSVFKDSYYDDKLMYTCHRYGGEPTAEAISHFIQFRDSVNLPMYMGEIGHGTDEWQEAFCKTMEANNIGYTFWPYKKINSGCMMGIPTPDHWDVVRNFSEAPRSTFSEIREARPDQETAKQALMDYVKNSALANCLPQEGYIRSILLKVP